MSILFIITLLVILVCVYLFFYDDYIEVNSEKYKLTNDGFCVLKNFFNVKDVENLKEKSLEENNLFVKEFITKNDNEIHHVLKGTCSHHS